MTTTVVWTNDKKGHRRNSCVLCLQCLNPCDPGFRVTRVEVFWDSYVVRFWDSAMVRQLCLKLL